jgi:hypothetical protein
MRLEKWRKPIPDRMREAVARAEREGYEVQAIVLTASEWLEYADYLRSPPVAFDGIAVRREDATFHRPDFTG